MANSAFDALETKQKRNEIKLCPCPVVIMDGMVEPTPKWLTLAKGVTDSVDLLLNISQELQKNRIVCVFNKRVKKKNCKEVPRTVLPALEAYVASLMTPRIKPNMPK